MKNKFCPKCGTKVEAGTKFCPKCGYNFGQQIKQAQPVQPAVSAPAPTTVQTAQQLKKAERKTKWLVALVVVAFLCCVGGFAFYHYKTSEVGLNYQKNKVAQLKQMDKLSSKDWASLVIAYAHEKYPDNNDWNEVYQDVKNGSANIEKSDEFDTEDGTVTSGDNEILYIVNDKTAFILPSSSKDSNKEVVLADSKKTLGKASAASIYHDVKNSSSAANSVGQIANKVVLYQNNNQTQSAKRDGFTDLQCAVMAYVYKDSSDPEGQITKLIDACTDYDAKDAWDTIPTGIGRYPNGGKNAYAISEGVESKKFWVFKFSQDSDDIDITCHHNGKITFHMTGNRSALIKRYGDYEDKLNTLINKINYNANHLDELRDKIDDDE